MVKFELAQETTEKTGYEYAPTCRALVQGNASVI